MKRRSRAKNTEAEATIQLHIETIDRCLSRFYTELEESDLKLADYFRLAELKSVAAPEGDKEVIVRWVDCSGEAMEQEEDDR